MKKELKKITYGIYYRKSSEAEDRQAQSIPDQIRDTDAVAKRENLNIGMRFPGESQSAFTIGRPIFADLTKSITEGKINAILVWHPNRLARNPVDAGMLLYLMDEGKLKIIQTPSRTYLNNSSDKFMLQLEFGMSKKDSDDKSEVVKRALEGRAKRGLPNGLAHIGYLNDQSQEKGNRGWIKDPVRYPLVKKLLTMMLTGKYSVRELHIFANEDLHLTTFKRKNVGEKPISLSYMYVLLKDPIHAGFFFQESAEGKTRYEFTGVQPMISEEEYWKIQDMLGTNGLPRVTSRRAAYNYFAKCGTCNGSLSTDFKFQVICDCKKKFHYLDKDKCPSCETAIKKMEKPTFLTYIFYYCINHKKGRTTCPKNGIEEKNLETQLLADLNQTIAISRELSAWCIDNIGKAKDQVLEDNLNIQRSLEQQKNSVEDKLKRLNIRRISADYSPEEEAEFDNLQKELREELSLLKLKLADTDVDWFKDARRDFDLMSEISLIIRGGTVEQKKDLLFAFGTNLDISAKKVAVRNKKSIEVFKNFLLLARTENKAFEPAICLANKDKTEVFTSVCPILLRR